MSIINDDTEAEDIMQVTYLNAYEKLGMFESRACFSTWLTRILINESLLRLRIKGRSINMQDVKIDRKILQQNLREVQTPVAKMINSELKTVLEQAIRQLPEKYRAVFVMREIEDMNITETQ